MMRAYLREEPCLILGWIWTKQQLSNLYALDPLFQSVGSNYLGLIIGRNGSLATGIVKLPGYQGCEIALNITNSITLDTK